MGAILFLGAILFFGAILFLGAILSVARHQPASKASAKAANCNTKLYRCSAPRICCLDGQTGTAQLSLLCRYIGHLQQLSYAGLVINDLFVTAHTFRADSVGIGGETVLQKAMQTFSALIMTCFHTLTKALTPIVYARDALQGRRRSIRT